MHFTPLERDVLDWIATRCDDAAIRAQLRAVEPVSREHTGVGAFLGLHVPGDVPSVPLRKAPVDPHIASPDLDDAGAGCVLFFNEGRASLLELYAFGAAFPETLNAWTLS
jgi:hypothetical protein